MHDSRLARTGVPVRGLLVRTVLLLSVAIPSVSSDGVEAQTPVEGELRQFVSFTFQPGRMGDAVTLYREEVVPLYEQDSHLLSFRAFREAESPVPVELVVVRAFRGMAGMDASGGDLRAAAERAGTSVGALYGRIAAFSTGHIDEFVAMVPEWGSGDPTASRLTAFVRLRLVPGLRQEAEAALAELATWEREHGIAVAAGRFILSDGWEVMRLVGFGDLAEYEEWLRATAETPAGAVLRAATVERSTALLGPMPELERDGSRER
ncbi:MAG: hypothetical protein KJP18_05870 [Gemmatimonadetes bacterium]|nr:hypothetical protein [Gemmatimonadota bacterium]